MSVASFLRTWEGQQHYRLKKLVSNTQSIGYSSKSVDSGIEIDRTKQGLDCSGHGSFRYVTRAVVEYNAAMQS